ncbi:flagellar assembly peptidoglycan hydrolase FlgJ [Alteromonas aestuariivivens]|uniref:Peptidoglycan hydrolase FlgJ n=1 Tax=Alteromonas aestuariivivens TaxID=1938339 RepID=A0A3D8M5Y0_9ALTE|nr:flagellar assembly peptidoglycan hydrolase FlgJ [Alteromonas aestuariivivens]RDV25031.1 flagellar assembly peptidoglycan hydrolase FlgJ [Alteromonas aestuariivivens]
MDTLHTQTQLETARNVHDMGSINSLREAIASGDEKVLNEAAQQFEAIFVQMMLKSMRQAQDALADEDSPFNSQQVKFYRDMHDQQMATDLASNGGLGLAELIVQQLGQMDGSFTPASVLRNDANLPSLNRQRQQVIDEAQQNVLGPEQSRPAAGAAFKAPMFESAQDFIARLYPYAKQAAQELGTDPKALIAQAAVETGWGQHVIHKGEGQSSNNLFGIKANRHWQGDQAVVSTLEFNGGVANRQKAAFRAYDSLGQGLQDYVEFIKSQPRYQQAVANGHDTQSYFESLQQAGYATDPEYASKVMAVYNGTMLKEYLP